MFDSTEYVFRGSEIFPQFSYPQATMVSVRKNYHFKKRCPKKIYEYGPAQDHTCKNIPVNYGIFSARSGTMNKLS